MHIPYQRITRTELPPDLAAFADDVAATLTALPVAEPVRPRDVVQPLAPGVEVISGLQAQGDVLILPAPDGAEMPHWTQPLVHDRPVTLIAEGNGHVLRPLTRGDGAVLWAPMTGYLHLIACLHIAGDAVALVEQPGGGHHPVGVGPGMYQIRRQRERVQRAPRDWTAWVAD